jgi:hypothetical protein
VTLAGGLGFLALGFFGSTVLVGLVLFIAASLAVTVLARRDHQLERRDARPHDEDDGRFTTGRGARPRLQRHALRRARGRHHLGRPNARRVLDFITKPAPTKSDVTWARSHDVTLVTFTPVARTVVV